MSEDSGSANRKYLPPLAELMDRMTIAQIKVHLLQQDEGDYEKEISDLKHDIDLVVASGRVTLNSEIIHLVTLLSQMNLHIWHNKDLMQQSLDDDSRYLALLKLSHQLNGLRNRVKNRLLALEGITDKGHFRSNFETDGLSWRL